MTEVGPRLRSHVPRPRTLRTVTTMEVHKAFTSATRTVSATSLRERLSSLSSLTATPLKPVANLHAQIECVQCLFLSLCLFLPLQFPLKRRVKATRTLPRLNLALVIVIDVLRSGRSAVADSVGAGVGRTSLCDALQVRAVEDPAETEAADPRGRDMVDDHRVVHVRVLLLPVSALLPSNQSSLARDLQGESGWTQLALILLAGRFPRCGRSSRRIGYGSRTSTRVPRRAGG